MLPLLALLICMFCVCWCGQMLCAYPARAHMGTGSGLETWKNGEVKKRFGVRCTVNRDIIVTCWKIWDCSPYMFWWHFGPSPGPWDASDLRTRNDELQWEGPTRQASNHEHSYWIQSHTHPCSAWKVVRKCRAKTRCSTASLNNLYWLNFRYSTGKGIFPAPENACIRTYVITCASQMCGAHTLHLSRHTITSGPGSGRFPYSALSGETGKVQGYLSATLGR